MTEFTIVGNLKKIDTKERRFDLEEGHNIYEVYVGAKSYLLDQLSHIPANSRIRVSGIIIKKIDGSTKFICNKATVLLGGEYETD